ncbi:MAG: alpha-amylase family glycosyl hydrolase [Ignavibacteriaceae bacterium]|nr:alpha-amylase family glycosyl hydrolase [Ignavibacteriaceae bacterium]
MKVNTFSKIFLLFLFVAAADLFPQTVPVTFHFKPEYTQFKVLRVVGTFSGWNTADDNYKMTDANGDGEYEITVPLAEAATHNYKFVMDASWDFAYGDPDNPAINIADNNNSMLDVKDPMITYLLPRGMNTKNEFFIDTTAAGLPIRAIFAFKPENPLNLTTLKVTIDGVDVVNPQQYYNSTKQEFLCQPVPALSSGNHTVSVSVSSSAGSVSKQSTFTRSPGFVIYQVPTDFYFDKNSSKGFLTQDVTTVSTVGEFNNWNQAMNPMQDNNNDGLWETTVLIKEGSYQYKMKINNSLWINDPDEPKFDNTMVNNLITVKADTISKIKLISPSDETVYAADNTQITFKAFLRPGVKSKGVNQSTIQVKLDDVLATSSFQSDSSIVNANLTIAGEGRHTVTVSFTNVEGVTALENYSYGIYTGKTGKYIVDAGKDEPYRYPATVKDGSCDILSVKIDETSQHDSLKFVVQMRDASDRTRLGLIIANPTKTLVSDPIGLDIKTYEWQGNGVFASIGAPGNAYESKTKENRFMISRDPFTASNELIKVNGDALTKKEFTFTVSLQFLDSLLTGWMQTRNFYLFSYLSAEDTTGSSYEVTMNDGGSYLPEDPDIYDAAFVRSGSWQKRMFANYIAAAAPMGPNYVSLDGQGRGILSLKATDISDSLATYGPVVTMLTPGVEYWYRDITFHGQLSDPTIQSISFFFNGVESTQPVVNGKFSVPITLVDGANKVYVRAVNAKGFITISKEVTLSINPDYTPDLWINGTSSGRQVTLWVNGSSPKGLALSYLWSQELTNPASSFGIVTDTILTFTMPTPSGEYYYNIRVKDSQNRIKNARILVKVESDSVRVADINEHAAWIDKAIVYEIYPRAFSDQGGFLGIVNKIPDMKDLGINTLWLMPIYKGPTTHGYEITDYYGFEEDYGTEADFVKLMTELKKAGIKIILDFVVNHTSIQHPFMQNVFEYRGYSPWANFYIWSGEPGNSNYKYEFDWASLPDLNHNDVEVRNYFAKVAEYWVKKYGIDGYRCDVAWGVEQRNQLFWQEWRKKIKNIKPEVFLEAEASSSDSTFYNKRFDSANDWDLRTKLLGAISGTTTIDDMNAEIMRQYKYGRPFRFVENHDEVRVTSAFDSRRNRLAHTILLTLNGVPLIYSGGEVGELTNRDKVNWSDPDNTRPYFKKIISVRNKYLVNPKISRLPNTVPAKIYTYASLSDTNIVLTTANLKNEILNADVDLSGLPWDGTSNYYLTDLIDGTVYTVTPQQHSAFQIALNEFESKLFYFSKYPVVVGVDEKDNLTVTEFKLQQNYPNPFNPTTTIKFQLPNQEHVSLKIFDMLGREVTTLVDDIKSAGIHQVEFNAAGYASGVYFYQVKAGKFLETKKFVLMK